MGKTSKELEEKLAELQAASVEAGVEFKRIDEQIEQAKLDFGMQVLEGKKADKSKLNELAEKRDELGMRLNALAKKIGDTQAELAEAKAVERTAAIEAYKAESAKQLEQEMKAFQEKFGSNWFQYFLRSYGAYSLAKFAGKEVVRAALENLNSERTKVWRTMKLLEEAERELLVLKQEEGSSKTLGELYEELRGKVCELAGRN